MTDYDFGAKVLWLTENFYYQSTKLKEHSHSDYYQIHYMMEGSGTFLLNGEETNFEEGNFFLLPPGMSHGISQVNPGSNGCLRMLEAKFSVHNQLLDAELRTIPALCQGTTELQDDFSRIFRDSVRKDFYYDHWVPHLFMAWLYQMISLCKNYEAEENSQSLSAKPSIQIKQYIDEHYTEDISLDDLAALVGYSKSYICQAFRKSTGMTINYYLNKVRINKATSLLLDPKMEVAEVGALCGYNSVFYFIKAFKKIVGIPPGSFQRSEIGGAGLVTGYVEMIGTMVRTSDTVNARHGDPSEAAPSSQHNLED